MTKIVTDMTIQQGKDIDNDVFWGKVSELMGGTRGRQQCRIKWFVFQFVGVMVLTQFTNQDGFSE